MFLLATISNLFNLFCLLELNFPLKTNSGFNLFPLAVIANNNEILKSSVPKFFTSTF